MSWVDDGTWCDVWIVLRAGTAEVRYTARPGAPLRRASYRDVRDLHESVVAQRRGRPAFIAECGDTLLRVKWFRSGRREETETYNLRRLPSRVPHLTETALPPPLAERLVDIGGRKGMVIVTGRVGAGKTWTASAIFTTWLELYSSAGVSIEDPPELPMEGAWKDGYCWQWEREENALGAGVMESLRSGMRHVYIGEIRTADAAREAIKAAAAGYTVIFCLHAGSPVDATQRLLTMASDAGQEQTVAAMIAEGLVALVHLDPDPQPDADRHPLTRVKALFGSPNVATLIRNRKFEHLRGEMESQAARQWRVSGETG